jgi:transcriptional regulator with XRE-family HTH domain
MFPITIENPAVAFGAFLRNRRRTLGLTARHVAEAAGLQPSNLSNTEHGLLRPPKDSEKLKKLAAALKLQLGDPEFTTFADLAAKATNSVPIDIATLVTEDEAIPVMLRSLGNKKLTKADIARIVALVRAPDEI